MNTKDASLSDDDELKLLLAEVLFLEVGQTPHYAYRKSLAFAKKFYEQYQMEVALDNLGLYPTGYLKIELADEEGTFAFLKTVENKEDNIPFALRAKTSSNFRGEDSASPFAGALRVILTGKAITFNSKTSLKSFRVYAWRYGHKILTDPLTLTATYGGQLDKPKSSANLFTIVEPNGDSESPPTIGNLL